MSDKAAFGKATFNGLLNDYKAALGDWMDAIHREMDLASCNRSVAEVARWQRACDAEEEARSKAISLRKEYESALRREFYHF